MGLYLLVLTICHRCSRQIVPLLHAHVHPVPHLHDLHLLLLVWRYVLSHSQELLLLILSEAGLILCKSQRS